MKIIHFSDTHLGAAAFNALDPATGLNIRELDFYKAFRLIVQAVCDSKPDLAIHAGDLFDTVRPPNRAITEAIEGFRRILDAGVPLVVAAGNHETPRIRATGNIFKALQAALPGACLAFDGECRRFDAGGAAVHAVGDATTEEELQKALEAVKPVQGRPNILVLHAGTSRVADRVQSGEYNQHSIPHENLLAFSGFDYIALGHYHRFMKVEGTENAFYCGPSERTGIDEAKSEPGYAEVELTPLRVRHVAIPARPMIDFPPIPCEGLSAAQVLERLRETLDGKIEGAIVRVTLDKIAPAVGAGIPAEELARLKKPALDCQIDFNTHQAGRRPGGDPLSFESLPVEFERFIAEYGKGKGFDQESVKALGLDYLGRVLKEGTELS
jgi:DNA repair exonuclease SbcCD nuclease subunit